MITCVRPARPLLPQNRARASRGRDANPDVGTEKDGVSHLQGNAVGDVDVRLNEPVSGGLGGVQELLAGDWVQGVEGSLGNKSQAVGLGGCVRVQVEKVVLCPENRGNALKSSMKYIPKYGFFFLLGWRCAEQSCFRHGREKARPKRTPI